MKSRTRFSSDLPLASTDGNILLLDGHFKVIFPDQHNYIYTIQRLR